MMSFSNLKKIFKPLDRVRRIQIERDVDDELQFHLEMKAKELQRNGYSEVEAAEHAARAFGHFPLIRDACLFYREGLPYRLVGSAVKSVVCMSLALGFAISIALVLYASVVKLPATYLSGGEWYSVWWLRPATGETVPESDLHEFATWKSAVPAFETLTIGAYAHFLVGPSDGGKEVTGKFVSDGYFDEHGVKPVYGRTFSDAEKMADGPRVVMLSEHFWREQYGRDTRIVGSEILINGRAHRVVGVLPQRFQMYNKTAFFLPIRPGDSFQPAGRSFLASGRLKDGSDLKMVEQQLLGVLGVPMKSGDMAAFSWRPILVRSQQVYSGPVHRSLYQYGLISLLLLFAAGIYVFRGQIRIAAGSVRRRVRPVARVKSWYRPGEEVLTTIGTAAVGSILGTALALATCHWLSHLILGDVARRLDLGIDASVLVFTVGLSLVTMLVLGFAPGVIASRLRR